MQNQRTDTAWMITERTYSPPVDLDDPDYETVRRRVTQTLEEARSFVVGYAQAILKSSSPVGMSGRISNEGGTVTFPDQTSLTVEAIEWRDAAAEADPSAVGKRAIVVSFNGENWR